MAWASASVSAADLAYLAEDKPLLMASHAIRDGVPSKEVWTETGNTTDVDHCMDDRPHRRAYDGFMNWGNNTRPATTASTWYLAFQFSVPQTFDSLILHGDGLHNAGAMRVEIADDATWTTRAETIVDITPGSTDDRFVELDLHHTGSTPLRYSGVEFLRLRITTILPAVSELWLSRRRQLWHHPETPIDDDHQVSVVSSVISQSGVVTTQVVEVAGARRHYSMTPAAGMITEIESFWDECLDGTAPFFLVETPSSAPAAYLMRYDGQPNFNPPNIGGLARTWDLPMLEQAPFLEVE